ncbi:hypothetical protein [Lachnoclostridium phytofermentans]|uniref:hypothetical protein n=1 Tax=Lachnoclostridium phytofermentans TaxID=66219 RepID=UPI00049850E5|nr:hypothetical protein [Lachnoclostridium phytofermentans]
MENSQHDKPEIPIKLDIPELVVEWQESDTIFETNTTESDINSDQIQNYLLPIFKHQRWKNIKIHITKACIFLSLFILIGLLLNEAYELKKTKSFLDFSTLDNIYKCYIYENNSIKQIIIDEDANVLYEVNQFENRFYEYLTLNRKIYWDLTENHELLFLTSKGSQVVANNVIEFQPSSDGLKVFYIIEQNSDLALFEYLLKSNSSVLIDNNVIESSFCISPDGNTIAYNKHKNDNLVTETYFFVQGKKQLKGINMTPIALTDDGTLFYYIKNQNLLVQSKSGSTQLMKVESNKLNNLALAFNQDHKELQYSYDSFFYQSTNGESGVRIKSYETYRSPFHPKYEVYINNRNQITFNIPHLSELKSFANDVTYQDWLKNINRFSYGMTSDNKIICLADGSVYYMENRPDKLDEIKKISGDLSIKQLVSSSDISISYMLTEDGDLYQLDSSGNRKLCLDFVSDIYHYIFEGEEEFYFIRRDPVTLVSSSLYYDFQLYYQKKDNTIDIVEGAGNISIVNSLTHYLIYKNAMDQTNQYFIPKKGKGIKVKYPTSNSDN